MTLGELVGRDFERLRAVKQMGRAHAVIELGLFDAGFQALFLYRLGHAARSFGIPIVPALARRLGVALCGIDILPKARIGPGCIISHGLGLVIGGDVSIGADCTLLQGVTLGEARFDVNDSPRLGDRVTVGAGAKVLGGITVGDDVTVGANAVVLKDVAAGLTVVGIPARPIGT